jgi:two-component sensor histidine kinase
VLEIDSPVQHDYDRHDVDFLTGFANVLAEAVNTSKRNAALRTALGRMEDMVADRDRLIAAKDLLLEEKNRLIAEKNVLAEELQHRVRNNLQLVHGMLSKQVQMTASPSGKEGLGAIARRVMTLAEVYDHLLGAGLRRTIDLDEYLASLCSRLSTIAVGGRRNIQLICRCHPVTLDLDSVTALGLIVAELISNCYTHAFPDGAGTISVSLVRNKSGDEAMLTVADNGIGFTEVKNSRRHGVGLVRRLMEQVRGSAALRSDNGSEWVLTFPVPAVSTIDSLMTA